MNKPLVLAVALVAAGVSQALYADAVPPASAPQVPAWVTESNQDSQIVLKTLASFSPEGAGQLGVDGLDEQATSMPLDVSKRTDKAIDEAGGWLPATATSAQGLAPERRYWPTLSFSRSMKSKAPLSPKVCIQPETVR